MRDRPILFSAPMVRALLAGRKTQTRRAIKAQPSASLKAGDHTMLGGLSMVGDVTWPLRSGAAIVSNKPGPHPRWVEEHVKYAVGDRLWVKETWVASGTGVWTIADARTRIAPDQRILYRADSEDGSWWSSLFMPREFSRLTLLVTDVRVERLSDISEADAIAEGIEPEAEQVEGTTYFRNYEAARGSHLPPCASFSSLWNSINGPDASAANPWVVAVTFEVHRRNIDQMPSVIAEAAE